jgi:hypothetical protein
MRMQTIKTRQKERLDLTRLIVGNQKNRNVCFQVMRMLLLGKMRVGLRLQGNRRKLKTMVERRSTRKV